MEKKWRKKLSSAIKSKDFDEVVRLRQRLSEFYKTDGRIEDAFDELKDLIDDLAHDKDKIRVGLAHRLAGEFLIDTPDFKQTVNYYKNYLRLAKEAGDDTELQRAHASLGRYYYMEALGAETETEKKTSLGFSYKHHLKGLSLASKLQMEHKIKPKEAAEMKSRLKINLALCSELEGRMTDALDHAESALAIVRENNCATYNVIKCLIVLSSIKSKSDANSSLQLICEALKLAETIAGQDGAELQSEIFEAKADYHLALGDFAQARKCLCDAYQLNIAEHKDNISKHLKMVVFIMDTLDKLKKMDDTEYAQRKKLFEQIGDCCVDLKALSKAVDYYKKMYEYCEILGADEKSKSAALASIAKSYEDLRSFSKAIEYYEKESELWMHEPKEECRSRMCLANVYERKNDPNNQLNQLNKARSLAEVSEDPKLQQDVLLLLLNYYKTNSTREENDICQILEDEICELKSKASGFESCSQETICDEEEAPYEDIDIAKLPDLQIRATKDSRTRKKHFQVTKNEKGETKLHTACIKGNLQQVQFLVNNGHPVTVYDQAGWAPIHEAANYGRTEIINFLLENGANIDEQGKQGLLECDGVTPLIDSCTNGHLTVVELLLERGAKVELKTVKPPRRNALNALDAWYNNNKEDLSEEDKERYCNIRQIMVESLLKAGERIEPDKSSFEPEYVLEDDDEMRMTAPNRKLLQIRSQVTTAESSDSDYGQIRRRKQTQKLYYTDEDDTDRFNSRRSQRDSEEEPMPSTSRSGVATSSVSEYRSAMDAMKRRNAPSQPSAPHKYSQPVSAFIQEDVAEWLENDVRPTTSKRRRLTEPRLDSDSRPKRSKRRDVLSSGSSSSSSRSATPEIIETIVNLPSSPFLPRDTTPSPNLHSDYKSSEGEEIYHVEKSIRRISPVKKSPAKRQRIVSSPKKVSPRKILQPEENISIKVNVADKTIFVPITNRDITIETLKEKISERYYKIEGMEPTLTLTTLDGAILSAEDPITVILKPNEFSADICAKVDSARLPIIPKRYLEATKLENIDDDEFICRCLEGSQATFEIKFENAPLGAQLPAFMKSLINESSLETIDLSGCSIEDSGLELLCSALKSLENLVRLNLSGNYLTSKGIDSMGCAVEENKSLKALQHLDLSHNMFGEDGFMVLPTLLDNLDLRSINLKDCDLIFPDSTLKDVPMLAFEKLVELDASYNSLGCNGVGHLFSRINTWNLQKLNLAYTNNNEEDSVAKEVSVLLSKVLSQEEFGGQMKELDLSGCNLQDVDIWDVLSAANESGIKIEHLKISYNPKLTNQSFQTLMNHVPALSKLTALDCPQLYCANVALPDMLKVLSISNSVKSFASSRDGESFNAPSGYVRFVSQ